MLVHSNNDYHPDEMDTCGHKSQNPGRVVYIVAPGFNPGDMSAANTRRNQVVD